MKLIFSARGWVMLAVLTVLVAVGSFAGAAPSDEAAASGPRLVIEAESAAGGTRAGLPEEAAMVMVGTALIGVAAAVRRAA